MPSNRDGGWFGALALSAGIVSAILLPFEIARRFGLHIIALFCAVVATLLALLSSSLVEMALSAKESSGFKPMPDLGTSGADVILALEQIGWWWMALVWWIFAILSLMAKRRPV